MCIHSWNFEKGNLNKPKPFLTVSFHLCINICRKTSDRANFQFCFCFVLMCGFWNEPASAIKLTWSCLLPIAGFSERIEKSKGPQCLNFDFVVMIHHTSFPTFSRQRKVIILASLFSYQCIVFKRKSRLKRTHWNWRTHWELASQAEPILIKWCCSTRPYNE